MEYSFALKEYLEKNEKGKAIGILAFVIRNYNGLCDIYGDTQMEIGIRMISDLVRKNYSKQLRFFFNSGRFVLVGDRNYDWEEVYEKLKERFESPWKSNNAELYLEAGFALIDYANGCESAEEVLDTIEIMLEKANSFGGELLVFSDDNSKKAYKEKVRVRHALKNAIENKNVEVYLQPIISAETDQIIGAEALARIRDDAGEMISPGIFIPAAEKSGYINQLGEQVLEKVCEFIRENENKLKEIGISYINVNLSHIQFMRVDLSSRFSEITEKYGINPKWIHLEIKEESMTDERFLERQAGFMRNKGFLLVLDDYGRGYSNLIRMKQAPFINVKIDLEVVWDYCRQPDKILPIIIDAFKKMGFTITSEGIETEEMADRMKELGSDYLQGMFYSAPLPMDDFLIRIIESKNPEHF